MPSKKETKKEEETVTVDKKVLEEMMKKIEQQTKNIEVLYEAADKARLSHVEDKLRGGAGNLIKQVRVTQHDFSPDNYVVGYKMTSNVAEVVNGRYIQDQRYMVIFDDGSEKEINIDDFFRRSKKIWGNVLSSSVKTDSKGVTDEYLEVEMPDGKKLQISKKYIN